MYTEGNWIDCVAHASSVRRWMAIHTVCCDSCLGENSFCDGALSLCCKHTGDAGSDGTHQNSGPTGEHYADHQGGASAADRRAEQQEPGTPGLPGDVH